MSERMTVTLAFVFAGLVLVLWGGLDVDNYWSAVGSLLMGVGIGRLDG